MDVLWRREVVHVLQMLAQQHVHGAPRKVVELDVHECNIWRWFRICKSLDQRVSANVATLEVAETARSLAHTLRGRSRCRFDRSSSLSDHCDARRASQSRAR